MPPRAARVPLTFHLAAGSPVDAVVPAGRPGRGAAAGRGSDEVVFETERNLVVTRAQLQAAFVSDTEDDTYSDRTGAGDRGTADEPFAVFTGDQPSPHQLYLACDPLLTQPGAKDVVLTLASPDTWQWQNWPVSWAYWDGSGWQAAASSAAVSGGAWRVTLPGLPAADPDRGQRDPGGLAAGPARPAAAPRPGGLRPESIAVGARNPQDLTLPLSPFPADSSVQRFYLSADEAFDAGGAQVTDARPAVPAGSGRRRAAELVLPGRRPVAAAGTVQRQRGAGRGPSGFDFQTAPGPSPAPASISFHVPMSWPLSLYRTRTGRWLRVDVASGQYTTVAGDRRAHRGFRLGAAAAGRHPGVRPAGHPPAAEPRRPPLAVPGRVLQRRPRSTSARTSTRWASSRNSTTPSTSPARTRLARPGRGHHPQRDPDQPGAQPTVTPVPPVRTAGQAQRSPGRCRTAASGTSRRPTTPSPTTAR